MSFNPIHLPAIRSFLNQYYRTVFAFICLVLVFFYSKAYSYMLFHTLVELFSIVVAFAVFIVAWNSRRMQDNKYLHVVGLSYLFIGALDLFHTLTFKGMNVIPSYGYQANQFWIATRAMEAGIFLVGFLMINRKRRVNSDQLFLIYSVITVLITASILVWKIFPVCFVEGQGQTPFKIYAEYTVILVLIISLGLLFVHRNKFDQRTFQLLVGSVFFAILSECCFATYTNNYGVLNEMGHYGKLVTFFLIYRANVEMSFVNPMEQLFRNLKASELEYKTLAENLPGIILRFDDRLNCIYSNQIASGDRVLFEGTAGEIHRRIDAMLKVALRMGMTQNGELDIVVAGATRVYAYQIIPEVSAKTSQTNLLVICRDITASRREKEYLSSLLDTIPHQVWTAKPDGSIDYVNDVVCRDFGNSRAELLMDGWLQYVHPDDLAELSHKWQFSLQSGEAFMTQFRLKMADGIYLWHLGRAVPIFDAGKVSLWIGTNTNIDAQKKGQELRDEFISVASHELKTPLTSIKAFNQMLARTSDLVKMQSYVQKVDQSTGKLERLINEMLDVSRINAGKLQFNYASFDISQLLQECCDTIQLSTGSHQLIFRSPGVVIINGDRFRLEQVINNLLNNAIKYSPKAREVVVSCKTDQGGVVVSVTDFGIGIESRELEQLFDRYYRSDNAAERFGGLGLGLFISSEIIKGHHGTFWIESVIGEGSTVSFRLPMEEIELPSSHPESGFEYHDEHLRIWCNQEKGWLDVNWTGYQNVETVQNGGLQMLSILKKSGFKKVLNDNREVLGNWSEASDWAAKVWFPMMIAAGLKDMAWVFSPSIFSQLAAQKSVDESDGAANVNFFHDMDEAVKWLESQ
ncbi:MASE3 domain-containing protein [Pedobacter frigidisoli]|uniref:sensor histidine kinase n=1 Tax=Pedobacter frigidisoli TaxID=2530455 RepID=UPI00292DE698|nr:MASE3 domain-containing protein [Pedobacter frigidisoli]